MNLISWVLCICCIYIELGCLLGVIAMRMIDEDADDYVLAFIIFWPISLIAAFVFQLIRFIERMFKRKY